MMCLTIIIYLQVIATDKSDSMYKILMAKKKTSPTLLASKNVNDTQNFFANKSENNAQNIFNK